MSAAGAAIPSTHPGCHTGAMSDWADPLVLASASQRRRELLETVGVPIEVIAADVDETLADGVDAAAAVRMLARRKAAAVAASRPARAVLAADTLVAIDGRLLGKPAGPDEARAMLLALSGRWHEVLTGVVLHTGTRTIDRLAVTEVRIAALDDEEIRRYVAGPEPYDKAGGYGIQAIAGWFVAEIRGSYSNVMGLPLETVREMLLEAGLPLPRLGAP